MNKTYLVVNFICVCQIWSKLIEKWPPITQDGRHEIYFFDISTSDRGYFPRIIEIALFSFWFVLFLVLTLVYFRRGRRLCIGQSRSSVHFSSVYVGSVGLPILLPLHRRSLQADVKNIIFCIHCSSPEESIVFLLFIIIASSVVVTTQYSLANFTAFSKSDLEIDG